jgi:hypothetical protein
MCDPISWAFAIGSTVASVAGGVTSKVLKDKAAKKAAAAHKQLELQQQRNNVADRNAVTAETIKDNTSNNVKRNLATLAIPLLKTQGTGMNFGSDVGLGLNLGGSE